ncbi:hypothetical protein QQF64_012463 [Cirrhinus molitorella]|uniref:Uncharacterized protein n=1 Tax=Cirrhinus molitorella TaxID=172907 RepID=A0ABR3LVR4_9TELE
MIPDTSFRGAGIVILPLEAKAISPPGSLAVTAALDHSSLPIRRHPHDLYFDIQSRKSYLWPKKTQALAFNDLFTSTPAKHRESAVLNRARSTHETVALICYDTPPSRPLRMMPCRTPLTAPALPAISRSR